MKQRHRPRWLSPILLCSLVFICCFIISFLLLDHLYTRRLDTSIPWGFPVLVISSENPQIIPHGELNKFIADHPDYSFLVPSGQETWINTRLMALWAQRGIDASPGIRVRELIAGRQALEVGTRGDGAWIGWYEATNKAVFPKFYKSYGPGFVIIVGLLALILTALTLLLQARLSRPRSTSPLDSNPDHSPL